MDPVLAAGELPDRDVEGHSGDRGLDDHRRLVPEHVRPNQLPGGPVGDDQTRTVGVAEAFARGADAIVVGRPISQAADPRAAAEGIQVEIALSSK